MVLALSACATHTNNNHYLAPSSTGVTQSINSSQTSVNNAQASNLDAKDEIRQAKITSAKLRAELEALRKRGGQ